MNVICLFGSQRIKVNSAWMAKSNGKIERFDGLVRRFFLF